MDKAPVEIDIQIADDLEAEMKNQLPSSQAIEEWMTVAFAYLDSIKGKLARTAASGHSGELNPELHIRIVSSDESQNLNTQYRNKHAPTNVLSFESDLPDFVPSGFIGDLVICAKVVHDEAVNQHKTLFHHWAHMCVHGALHLLGFDHIDEKDAEIMEALEVEILNKLGIDDPYQIR